MSEERIITAAVVGDMAYSEKSNIEYTKTNDFHLVSKLNPVVTQGARKREDQFEFNKDAGRYVCKAGHMAIRKGIQGKKCADLNQAKSQESDYFKEKARERYKIEAKNSELKNRHGYDTAIAAGLGNMELQGRWRYSRSI